MTKLNYVKGKSRRISHSFIGSAFFLSSEKCVSEESHHFMKKNMHLPNLCVYQFLLYCHSSTALGNLQHFKNRI